jgi:hypothetical protein
MIGDRILNVLQPDGLGRGSVASLIVLSLLVGVTSRSVASVDIESAEAALGQAFAPPPPYEWRGTATWFNDAVDRYLRENASPEDRRRAERRRETETPHPHQRDVVHLRRLDEGEFLLTIDGRSRMTLNGFLPVRTSEAGFVDGQYIVVQHPGEASNPDNELPDGAMPIVSYYGNLPTGDAQALSNITPAMYLEGYVRGLPVRLTDARIDWQSGEPSDKSLRGEILYEGETFGTIAVNLDAAGRLARVAIEYDEGDSTHPGRTLPLLQYVDTPNETELRAETISIEFVRWGRFDGIEVPLELRVTQALDAGKMSETITMRVTREPPRRLGADETELTFLPVPEGTEVSRFHPDGEVETLVWYGGRVREDDGSYTAEQIEAMVAGSPLGLAGESGPPWWRSSTLIAAGCGLVVIVGIGVVLLVRRSR